MFAEMSEKLGYLKALGETAAGMSEGLKTLWSFKVKNKDGTSFRA
jgi:hypothetical protein